MKKSKVKEQKKILNKKYIIISIIAILVLAITIGIIILSKPKESKVESDFSNVKVLTEADEVEAAKLVKENIVRVVNKIGEHEIVGTGFFIEEGYLLTNSHNVDIEGTITIEYYDGTTSTATLYSNSIDLDVALLKVEEPKAGYMTFVSTENLEVTNSVLAAGYAFNFKGEASITKGYISAKRESGILNYIQSDISMNKGCSGGPLFNAKAEIIGMNTFASETGNIGIAISSESIKEVIKLLLDEPSVNYLTKPRPANPINDILVNIGYTDDSVYELYDDTEIIESIIGDADEEDIDNQVFYYCEEGYTLSGTMCIKRETYKATKIAAKCKSGFSGSERYDGTIYCTNPNYINGTYGHTCLPHQTMVDGVCVYEDYETGTINYQSRFGSCPKGKTCYEIGRYAGGTVFEVVAPITCPSGSSSVSSGKYVWDGEEVIESNYKTKHTFYTSYYEKKYDSDGLVYYDVSSNSREYGSNCVKEVVDGVNVLYTYDQLKSSACKEGKLTKITSSGEVIGFYCKLTDKPTEYAWDVSCANSSYEFTYSKDGYSSGNYGAIRYQFICRKKVTKEAEPYPTCLCPKGYYQSDRLPILEEQMRYEGIVSDCAEACCREEEYIAKPTYKCNENDTLSGTTCTKTTIINAKTKDN